MRPAANPLLTDTGTPPIPEAKGWMSAYNGLRGKPIDLSQAAPGHAPADMVMRALVAAATDPATAKYGPIRGEDTLRDAYALEMSRTYGAALNAEDSVIVSGCNQAFVMTILAIAKAGDDVLLPAPWYFNHKMALDMLGIRANPLLCRAEDGFVPDVNLAKASITDTTRAIVLVTPNNPTGAIYPPETIAAFAKLTEERGIWLVLDETYRDFLPLEQQRPHELYSAKGGVPDHVIQLYSFSKAYCLPGYRLGAMTAPQAFMPELAKVLDTIQICPPRIGQIAIGKTMAETLPWREANRAMIAERAKAFRFAMAHLNSWEIGSVGAYFAYVKPHTNGMNASDLAKILATEHGILTLPGSYFGPSQEHWLRIAFANASAEDLTMLGERLSAVDIESMSFNDRL
jgi:aspartate/methionine/tyrosine aminotransferase